MAVSSIAGELNESTNEKRGLCRTRQEEYLTAIWSRRLKDGEAKQRPLVKLNRPSAFTLGTIRPRDEEPCQDSDKVDYHRLRLFRSTCDNESIV
jgi:hypothetical protein